MTNFLCEYCNVSTVALGILTVLILKCMFSMRRPKLFPPGPIGLPFVGNLPFLGSNMAETVRKMKETYGPVMSLKMGRENWVVLNDYNAIHQALVKQGDKFSGRPSSALDQALDISDGMAMADYGPMWKSLRKFGIQTLRGFGVGKKSMEDRIIEECGYLIEGLTPNTSDIPIKQNFTMAVSNIICGVVRGSRYTYDDEKFSELIRRMNHSFSDPYDSTMLGIMIFLPISRHLPFLKNAFLRIKDDVDFMMTMMEEIVEQHETTYDENHLRDFVDAFLKEKKERVDGTQVYFTGKILKTYIRELFEAGTETTSTTLNWCMLCFCHYPECQEKIAKEIETVMGESGVPAMKHRDELPYTCAFIQEIMRHRTLVPMGVFHKTNEECNLNGFIIPKDTTVIPNILSVHFDPDLFENPEEFKPERFLDETGKFVKSHHVIPFSVGPRFCLGEQLARMEIFLFLTSIIQKFRILPDPSCALPSFFGGVYNGITYGPNQFQILFENR